MMLFVILSTSVNRKSISISTRKFLVLLIKAYASFYFDREGFLIKSSISEIFPQKLGGGQVETGSWWLG
jgi:hypothetical protein